MSEPSLPSQAAHPPRRTAGAAAPLRAAHASALALALALAGSLTAAAPAAAQGPPPAPVKVDAARLERLEHLQRVTGELRAPRRVLLTAEFEGRVTALDFEEGQQMRKGEVLARLDATLTRLGVEEAEAELLASTAQIDERKAEEAKAKLDLERAERLLQTSSVGSQADVDDRRTGLAAATARLKRAQADRASAAVRLERARERLGYMTLSAPFDAVLVQRPVELGQWVRPGDLVGTLVDLTEIEAWLNVPERWISRIANTDGPPAEVAIEVAALGLVRRASVAEIIPVADPLSRLFPVRVRLTNLDLALKPGLRVTALVPTGESGETLTVHKDALLRDDAGAFLYISQGGVARAVRIEPLFAAGDRFAVRASGVEAGTLCVTEGNERLFPGRPLALPPSASPGPAAP